MYGTYSDWVHNTIVTCYIFFACCYTYFVQFLYLFMFIYIWCSWRRISYLTKWIWMYCRSVNVEMYFCWHSINMITIIISLVITFFTIFFSSYNKTRKWVISIWHYDDVTMSGMASQITSLAIVSSTVYPGADQRKHQSPRHWPLCVEFTGEFPAQMASNAENVSIWLRHHGKNFKGHRISQLHGSPHIRNIFRFLSLCLLMV